MIYHLFTSLKCSFNQKACYPVSTDPETVFAMNIALVLLQVFNQWITCPLDYNLEIT